MRAARLQHASERLGQPGRMFAARQCRRPVAAEASDLQDDSGVTGDDEAVHVGVDQVPGQPDFFEPAESGAERLLHAGQHVRKRFRDGDVWGARLADSFQFPECIDLFRDSACFQHVATPTLDDRPELVQRNEHSIVDRQAISEGQVKS